jgi:hypothetical protein
MSETDDAQTIGADRETSKESVEMDLQRKKEAVAEAVRTASAVNKQDVAAEAFRSLPSDGYGC